MGRPWGKGEANLFIIGEHAGSGKIWWGGGEEGVLVVGDIERNDGWIERWASERESRVAIEGYLDLILDDQRQKLGIMGVAGLGKKL